MGSDYLFVQPSFLRGVARVLDVGSTMSNLSYNGTSSPDVADQVALQIDAQTLGEDMQSTLEAILTEDGEEEER